MSYTPHTWGYKETITNEKLNNIEEGIQEAAQRAETKIARVVVDCRPDWGGYSVVAYMGFARYDSDANLYSIEAPLEERYTIGWTGRIVFLVPLSDENDEFQPYIFFSQWMDDNSDYTITGDISTEKIAAHYKEANNTWNSYAYYGFRVAGDGEIIARHAG